MLAFVEEPSGMEDDGVHDSVTQSRNGRKRSLVGGQYPNGTNGYDKVTSLVSLSYLMRTDTVTKQINLFEKDPRVPEGLGQDKELEAMFGAAFARVDVDPTNARTQEILSNTCIQWITARVIRTLGSTKFVGLFNNDPMLVNVLKRDGKGTDDAARQAAAGSLSDDDDINLIFPFQTDDEMFLSPFLIPKGYTSYTEEGDRGQIGALMLNRIAPRHIGQLPRTGNDDDLKKILCTDFVPDGMKSGTKYSQMANGSFTLPTTEALDQNKPYLRLDSTQFERTTSTDNSNPANPHDDVRYRALYQSVYFGRGGGMFKKYESGKERYDTCFLNEAVGLLSPHCLGNFSPAGFVLYKYSTAGMDEMTEKMLDASQHGLFEIVVGGLSTVTEFAFNHERYMNERLHECDKDTNAYPTLEEKRRLRTSTLDELYVLVIGVVVKKKVGTFWNKVPAVQNLRLVRCTSEELYKYSTPDPLSADDKTSDDAWFTTYKINNPPSSQFRRMKSAGLQPNELILGGWRIGKVLDTAATRMMPGYTQNAALDPSTFGVTVDVDIEWVSSIDLHDKYWSVEGYAN